MFKKETKKGITLISLVITIIIMIILATVAINLAVDGNGLFRRAGQAANDWNSSVAEEEGFLTNMLQLADEIGKEPAINTFYQNGGSIEVKFVDKNNNMIEEPLAPVLGTGMTPVKWSGTEWVNTTSSDEEWYDYSQSKWANAKTADGSMWVWIPRYAYEMTYTLAPYTSYTVSDSGMINTYIRAQQYGMAEIMINEEMHEIYMQVNISGISMGYTSPAYPVEEEEKAKATGSMEYALYEKNEDGTYTITGYMAEGEVSSEKTVVGYSNSKGIVTAEGRVVAKLEDGIETTGKYIVHPAFGINLDLGGWSEPLDGIWVAKYEMSMETDGVATTTSDETIGNVLTTDSIKMVSKPDVSSWTNITIGNMYTNCYNYSRGNESHLMKSSEWGAVAYLSYSQYGTNGVEIATNTSGHYTTAITGAGGVAASSTGNETGIYDLSGGGAEYVAAYDKLGGNNLSTYGSSFATGTSTKYSTAYINGTAKAGGKKTVLNVGKTGDATREMLGYQHGWNSDVSTVVSHDIPFSTRGDGSGDTTTEWQHGIFCSNTYFGSAEWDNTFRAVLAPSDV